MVIPYHWRGGTKGYKCHFFRAGGAFLLFSLFRAIMPPPAPLRRLAVMARPDPSAEARAAAERKEKKKKKLEEKKEAHRRAVQRRRQQKKEKKEKEKKKKEDKKKEVFCTFSYYFQAPPYFSFFRSQRR